MKNLICGSRNITDLEPIARAVRESGFDPSEIISGGVKGVDSLAKAHAAANRLPVRVFKPDWKKYGKRAGILRNLEMVKEAEAVVAIWDGESRDTRVFDRFRAQVRQAGLCAENLIEKKCLKRHTFSVVSGGFRERHRFP